GQLLGRSPYMQPVHVEAPETWLGRIVEVEITAGHPNSLAAQLVEPGRSGSERQNGSLRVASV
ncbi:MAG: TRAM domain-containing protein, partial [Rhodospirillales bacterium]